MGIHDLYLFMMAGLLLNITPGADNLYAVGRSASQGFRGGITAAFGICAGCLVHIAAATLGLSAILAASSTAFTIVKIIGAIYLVYLGIALLRNAGNSGEGKLLPAAPTNRIFWQGFFTNVLNPKVAIFFLSFLPQFISSQTINKPLAMLFLGLIFVFNSFLWLLALVWFSSRVAGNLKQNRIAEAWVERIAGSAFIIFGIRLALSKH